MVLLCHRLRFYKLISLLLCTKRIVEQEDSKGDIDSMLCLEALKYNSDKIDPERVNDFSGVTRP